MAFEISCISVQIYGYHEGSVSVMFNSTKQAVADAGAKHLQVHILIIHPVHQTVSLSVCLGLSLESNSTFWCDQNLPKHALNELTMSASSTE